MLTSASLLFDVFYVRQFSLRLGQKIKIQIGTFDWLTVKTIKT